MKRNTVLPVAGALVLFCAVLVAVGCTGTAGAPAGEEMKKFGSAEEISKYLEENMELAGGYGYGATFSSAERVGTAVPAAADAAGEQKAVSTAGAVQQGTGYSTTNVQVAGVDEPDFVKNDGRYIYIVSGTTLEIVDAYPAGGARIVSGTELEDTVQEIFLAGDRLAVFATERTSGPARTGGVSTGGTEKVASAPAYYRTGTVTHVTIYDIADRKNPSAVAVYTVDGDYTDARMIGGIVYLLTRENVYGYDDFVVPVVRKGGSVVAEPDVYYFDNPESSYVFSTVTAIGIADGKERDAKTFLIGSGNIHYVSENAMYVSYQKWHPVYRAYYDEEPVISAVSEKDGSTSASSSSAGITYEEFNRLSEEEKQEVVAELKAGDSGTAVNREYDQTTTVIHKIAIGGGNIAYRARGEVPGYLDNQFSMDEYGGNLRIATTSDVWTRYGQETYNNVFVLDGSMETVGSLTHVAEDEKIYATRFIGDRLYMVTFRQMDPFFVIDLSDPSDPVILGKLKIPGYSDYLHPYDRNTVIGVGKETVTGEWGGVSARGVKLALFDVSDVENPRQIDKVEIGEAGSDSAALYDHKAFLFDREKNLLVLPIRQVASSASTEKPGTYGTGQQVWYGAYVFGVSPETGFTLRGTVEHGTSDAGYYWYGSSDDEVKRSLYIGNDLYTISPSKIVASDLADLSVPVKTIPLAGGPDYPDLPLRSG